MKTNKLISLWLLCAIVISCKQEVITLQDSTTDTPVTTTPTKGSADFTKFVSIGNSLASGYQAGALFTEGQNNSFTSMLATQFALVGGGAFNQPTIGSENGYYGVVGPYVLGRLKLFDPDGSGPRSAGPTPTGTPATNVTCPSTVSTPAIPGKGGDLPSAFTGDKSALNNFGVPGIQLGQVLTPLTGGPSTGNSAYNGLYARFASNPGTSTILGDAIAAKGTFYLFELGANDILGYATQGGLYSTTVTIPGAIPLTPTATFQGYLNSAIGTLLASNANIKGVISNIPDVTSIPYFFTVTWNTITLDQTTVSALTSTSATAPGLSTSYNGFLDQLKSLGVITQAEVDKRKLTFKVGAGNPILIDDETLTDLSPYMTGAAAALAPYKRTRQTTSSDLVTLSAGSVLGTCYGGSATEVYGVSYPVPDQYILIPTETSEIKTRTAELNAAIKASADGSNGRLALADVNTFFNTFVANKAALVNGVTLTPSLSPPTGGFSEDGVHPNSRGYAYMANVYIDAINAKFGSTLPKIDISKYAGTALPINP